MSIVLCVPFVYPHHKHIPHLMEFYAHNKAKHDLHLHWEMGRPLHKVQGNAVEYAREIGASHVLFTEHDQWAYPMDGLDILLEADKEVVGLPTYMRKYPYLPMCMHKIDKSLTLIGQHRNLRSFFPTEPMVTTDLITWAFTLVKMSVFDKLDEAGLNPWQWNEVPTDSYFCQYCEDLGIERWINASYFVNHGDVPKQQVSYHRRMYDAIAAANGLFAPGSLPKDQAIEQEDDPRFEHYQTQLEKMKADAAEQQQMAAQAQAAQKEYEEAVA